MLSDAQIERYSRQIILPGFGGRGQEALLSASAAIVGAGDIGCTLAAYLCAAGIGRLGIVDSTVVATAAPCAGIFYNDTSGQNRARTAAAAFTELNPDCQIESWDQPLTDTAAGDLAKTYDILIGAEISFEDGCLLNDACVAWKKPLLWGSAAGLVGEVSAFFGYRSDAPCYQCVYSSSRGGSGGVSNRHARNFSAGIQAVGKSGFPPENCGNDELEGSGRMTRQSPSDKMNIFAVGSGLIGTVLATEVMKIVLHSEGTAVGRVIRYDGYAGTVHQSDVAKDPYCVACSTRPITPRVTT